MTLMELLIQHGRAGHLGRCQAEGDYRRGDTVIVETVRGREWGEVLRPLRAGGPSLGDPFLGAVVRKATDADLAQRAELDQRAARLVTTANELARAQGLPLEVIDAELLFDGRTALLHTLAFASTDADPLLAELGERFGLIVRLHDLVAAPPTPADNPDHNEPITCGKPDCGSGDCSSCSTSGSGCNSCSSGQANELAAHFSALRDQMESRRTPLV